MLICTSIIRCWKWDLSCWPVLDEASGSGATQPSSRRIQHSFCWICNIVSAVYYNLPSPETLCAAFCADGVLEPPCYGLDFVDGPVKESQYLLYLVIPCLPRECPSFLSLYRSNSAALDGIVRHFFIFNFVSWMLPCAGKGFQLHDPSRGIYSTPLTFHSTRPLSIIMRLINMPLVDRASTSFYQGDYQKMFWMVL